MWVASDHHVPKHDEWVVQPLVFRLVNTEVPQNIFSLSKRTLVYHFFPETFYSSRRMLSSWRRSHKFTRISSQSQTSSRKRKKEKRGKRSYIQTETILDITSLATASFIADVIRSLDDVIDLLSRMHMPILLIREKEIFLRIRDAITEYGWSRFSE